MARLTNIFTFLDTPPFSTASYNFPGLNIIRSGWLLFLVILSSCGNFMISFTLYRCVL